MKKLITRILNKVGYYSLEQVEEDIDATWDAAITWRENGGLPAWKSALRAIREGKI
jgi:hypothetical protein